MAFLTYNSIKWLLEGFQYQHSLIIYKKYSQFVDKVYIPGLFDFKWPNENVIFQKHGQMLTVAST